MLGCCFNDYVCIMENVHADSFNTVISYQMPAYKYNGIPIYFAAWKNHWVLYPARPIIKEPLPEALITQLVKKRVEENTEKATAKATSPKDN